MFTVMTALNRSTYKVAYLIRRSDYAKKNKGGIHSGQFQLALSSLKPFHRE